MDEEKTNNKIQSLLEDVQQKYSELKQEYDNFSELRDELRNKMSNVRSINTEAGNKYDDISNKYKSIQDINDRIEESYQNIEQYTQEINSYHKHFIDLKNKIEDEEEGIEAKYQLVQNIQKQATEQLEEAKKRKEAIKEIEDNAQNDKKEIIKIKEDSSNLKSEIEKWLDLIDTSARYNEFSRRQKELVKESYIWIAITVFSFLSLSGLIFLIFIYGKTDGVIGTLNKFLYITPLAILIIWSMRQYIETRLYLEKYAYKAVISVSLSSYLELFESKFGENDQKSQEFAIDTIKKIFKEPYIDKDKRQVINLFGGKVVYEDKEVSRSVNERTETIDEQVREENIDSSPNSSRNSSI